MNAPPLDALLRIDKILYQQVVTNNIVKGDLVLDLNDGCYGVCDWVYKDMIAIRQGIIVELGVKISRVRKLIPSPFTNSLN